MYHKRVYMEENSCAMNYDYGTILLFYKTGNEIYKEKPSMKI